MREIERDREKERRNKAEENVESYKNERRRIEIIIAIFALWILSTRQRDFMYCQ